MASFDPAIRLQFADDAVALDLTLDNAWAAEVSRALVTTELLGKAIVPDLPFVRPDGLSGAEKRLPPGQHFTSHFDSIVTWRRHRP